MTTYNAESRTWSRKSDPKSDIIPSESYIGKAVLKRLQASDPERIVEVNHDTDECFSVSDVLQNTVTIAMNLNDLNLKVGDIVALYCRHNSYISSLAYGCYLNGTPWCPFDTMSDDLDYLLDYIMPTVLIYDEEFKPKVKEALQRLNLSCITHELVFGNPSSTNSVENVLLKKQDISGFIPRDLSLYGSSDQVIACVSFTSGSTGKPKAVPIKNSMFVYEINGLAGTSLLQNPNTNIISFSSIRWISQLALMLATVFFDIRRTSTGRYPDHVLICETIHKRKPTAVFVSTSMYFHVLEHFERSKEFDFSSLEYIICGGEPFCTSLQSRFHDLIPDVRIFQGYGMTECGGTIALQSDLGSLNGGHLKKGFSIRIVDENGEKVSYDTPGTLQIKGTAVFPGYLKNEICNQEVFSEDGWFTTGDYGLVTKDNCLSMVCRYKDIITFNGKKIIPCLVEQHVNHHPIVNASLMVNIPGESDQIIVFFVKLRHGFVGDNLKRRELIEYIHKFAGSDIVFELQFVESFKRVSSGKYHKEFYKNIVINDIINKSTF